LAPEPALKEARSLALRVVPMLTKLHEHSGNRSWSAVEAPPAAPLHRRPAAPIAGIEPFDVAGGFSFRRPAQSPLFRLARTC
jgi:hypothetical protein